VRIPANNKKKHDRVTQEKTHLMYSLIRLKMLASCVLLSLAFLPRVQAVLPAPDGGYPGNNTAEGSAALFNLFSGVGNTAVGRQALFFDVTGSYNTAIGFASLVVTCCAEYRGWRCSDVVQRHWHSEHGGRCRRAFL